MRSNHICAWCGTDLPAVEISASDRLKAELQAVSHGICEVCAVKFCGELAGLVARPARSGTEVRA